MTGVTSCQGMSTNVSCCFKLNIKSHLFKSKSLKLFWKIFYITWRFFYICLADCSAGICMDPGMQLIVIATMGMVVFLLLVVCLALCVRFMCFAQPAPKGRKHRRLDEESFTIPRIPRAHTTPTKLWWLLTSIKISRWPTGARGGLRSTAMRYIG